MKKVLMSVAIVSILLEASLFACSSKEIWAQRSAHRIVAGKILKTTRVPSDGDKGIFSVEVKVAEVLQGSPMKEQVIKVEMEHWNPKEVPSYDSDKSYVIYLRKENQDEAGTNAVTGWTTKYGLRSIQPDTAKLRKMIGPDTVGKDKDYRMSKDDLDIGKPSPLEKRLHAIVIPEVDFSCAALRDVVDFLHEASIEYDQSSIPKQEKGINICLNARSFSEKDFPLLVNFYLEEASVLQVLILASALRAGEYETIGDWVVVSKTGSGERKPNISLGSQGTNSVLYKKLQSTVIPEIDFRGVAIEDVAKALAATSDLKISVGTNSAKAESAASIILAGKHVSLLGLLEVLSVLHPLEIVIEKESVVIRHPPLLQEKDLKQPAADPFER